MNVLLVMPPHNSATDDSGLQTTSSRLSPPLGMAYLAAGLRQRGHGVRLLDGAALGWTVNEVAEAAAREVPDLVGIPCYTVGRPSAYMMADRVKSHLPGVPIVMGGPHVTFLPDSVLAECQAADLLLGGEAEFTLAELVDRIEAGRSYEDIPGICFRRPNGTIVSVPVKWETDLDRYPFPARDVFDARLYNHIPLSVTCPPTPVADVVASRGCSWGRCRYCTSCSSRAAPYRRRSVENVMAELAELVEQEHVRMVFFRDDNLTNDHAWLTELCDRLDQRKWGLKWLSNARVDTVTPELLRRIAASGCLNLIYGFESGNQETLNLIRKGTTLDQARRAVKWTHDAGIEIHDNWMIAFPGETPAMAEKTYRFASELNAAYFEVFAYQVIPKTPLAELAFEDNANATFDSPSMFTPHYVPHGYVGKEQISALIRSFYAATT